MHAARHFSQPQPRLRSLLPVVVVTQIGVIVRLGVLLDTLSVRTLVVLAIVLLLGERFWCPPTPAEAAPDSRGL